MDLPAAFAPVPATAEIETRAPPQIGGVVRFDASCTWPTSCMPSRRTGARSHAAGRNRRHREPGPRDSAGGSFESAATRASGPSCGTGPSSTASLGTSSDLPVGWTDEQDGGRYRLRRRHDEAFFGYAVGPHSWKRFLEPPAEVRWRARRVDRGFEDETAPEPSPRYAFVGVRPCELAAILVQDRVFLGHGSDPVYRSRREAAFLVVVNCGARRHLLLRVDGHGPARDRGYDLF